MRSNRKPFETADRATRALAFAAIALTIAALASTSSCSDQATRTPGGGMTGPGATSTGTASSGAAGDVGGVTTITSSTGAAGSTTTVIPSTGAAGAAAMPTPVASACATASTPGAAPPSYVTECSSCHGMTANGRNGYPSLRTNLTLADLTAVVRAGRVSTKLTFTTAQGKTIPATMPAFSQARLSDADLAAIFAYRSAPASADAPVPAVYCLSRPEATWTPAQVDEAYQRGLKAWRTQGTVDQNACSFCHAADAMDLAFIGYTDGAISTAAPSAT